MNLVRFATGALETTGNEMASPHVKDWGQELRAAMARDQVAGAEFLQAVASRLASDEQLSEEQTTELVERIRAGELTEATVNTAKQFYREFLGALNSAVSKRRSLDAMPNMAGVKAEIADLEKRLNELRDTRKKSESKMLGLSAMIASINDMHRHRPDLLGKDFDAQLLIEMLADSSVPTVDIRAFGGML